MKHQLKVWPEYYEAVILKKKTFEIRENDRGYITGDIVVLREWCPKSENYTGRRVQKKISYITDFGQKPGFVVFSIVDIKECEEI